jgi:acyl dehydratase
MAEAYYEDITVGDVRTSGPYHVTEAEMVDFARKWDPLPFHIDEAAARSSVYGGLIASGEYTMAVKQLLIHGLGINDALIGSMGYDELRYRNPVRPDDRLSLTIKYIDKRESCSKPDRGIVKFEVTLSNQNGDPVLDYIDIVLFAKRAA